MSNSEDKSSGHLALETLIAIIILLIYTISAPIFEKYRFHYMHESGMCMIIGVAITIVAMVFSPEANFEHTLKFDDEIFFTFILPPIIFAAGYNLRGRSFFKYFLYIALFGVLGTLMTFSVVAPLTYIANYNKWFYFTFYDTTQNISQTEHTNKIFYSDDNHILLNDTFNDLAPYLSNESEIPPPKDDYSGANIDFSFKEILLFASVISATDTVAALTFVKEESHPKLFSILFGEGVLNDAVCIVLYRILRDFTTSNEEFTSKTPFFMIGNFASLFFFSFLVGSVVGALSSVFLKSFKNMKLNRVQETSVVVFFAFISYTLSEELGLSPIIALLFTGIIMANYTFYNLSFQAREESAVVSKIMANIAEAFVFTYLGLTMIYYMTHTLSVSFVLLELLFVIFGRIVGIFGLSYIMNFFKVENFKIKFSEKGIMSCAGSIRGAIAFGLAISIDSKNKMNKEVLVSSTLILVFFTTIVFGALMPFLIKFFQSYDKVDKNSEALVSQEDHAHHENEELLYDFMHPNFSQDLTSNPKEKEFDKLKNRLSYWLGTYWVEFDFMYIKPKLVNNWPQVRYDTEIVAHRIKDAMNDYSTKKKMKYIPENLSNEEMHEEDEKPDNMFKDLKVLQKK